MKERHPFFERKEKVTVLRNSYFKTTFFCYCKLTFCLMDKFYYVTVKLKDYFEDYFFFHCVSEFSLGNGQAHENNQYFHKIKIN